MNIPDAAIEAGEEAIMEAKSSSVVVPPSARELSRAAIEAAEPHMREAIAQEIKAWEASLPDPGARIGPILRIIRGGTQ